MSTQDVKFILVLISHNQASLLYDSLTRRGCIVELRATPAILYKGCTQSIIFELEDTEMVVEELKKNSFDIGGIYKIIKDVGKEGYESVNWEKLSLNIPGCC